MLLISMPFAVYTHSRAPFYFFAFTCFVANGKITNEMYKFRMPNAQCSYTQTIY